MLFNEEQIKTLQKLFKLIYSTGVDENGVIFLDISDPIFDTEVEEELDPLFLPSKKKREPEYQTYQRVIKTGLTFSVLTDDMRYTFASYITPEYEPISINLESIYTLIDSDKLKQINKDPDIKELLKIANFYIMDKKYIQYGINIK